MSSCGSSASARTHGSTRSTGSRNPPRPSSVARLAPSGSGAISDADFEKAFGSHPRMNVSMSYLWGRKRFRNFSSLLFSCIHNTTWRKLLPPLAASCLTLARVGTSEWLLLVHIHMYYGVGCQCCPMFFQLKDLRAVADQEIIDHTHFAMLLKGLEDAMAESVRNFYQYLPYPIFHKLSYIVICAAEGLAVSDY